MKKPVFATLLGSMAALALAAPALAQDGGSVRDFQLPTDQPSPRGQVQGPVTDGVAAPRVARPTPTPAAPPPRVEAQTPTPAVTITPAPVTSAPRTVASPAAARAQPTSTPAQASASPAPEQQTVTAAAQPPQVNANPPASAPAETAPQATAKPATSGGFGWWPWLLALVVVGVIGGAAGWFWRGRRASAPMYVPEIERPRVPERPPQPSGPPAELPKVALTRKERDIQRAAEIDEELALDQETALGVALEPARLSVSLLNATLAYRILLTNRGETALQDISIDGDMISAHASLPEAEQVAALNSKLENRHLIRTLGPGETRVVRGEFALPLPLIRPIRRGEATLFVPLARLRVVTGGDAPQVLVQTSVVGQRSNRPGGGLRPFRLDLGPRIYSELAQRAFA